MIILIYSKKYGILSLEERALKAYSDFGAIARFFKNRRLGLDALSDTKDIEHIHEVLEMLSVFTNDDDYERVVNYVTECKEKGGRANMCTVAQALKREGRAEGRAEGIITTCLDLGLTAEETIKRLMDKMSYSEEEARELVSQYA